MIVGLEGRIYTVIDVTHTMESMMDGKGRISPRDGPAKAKLAQVPVVSIDLDRYQRLAVI